MNRPIRRIALVFLVLFLLLLGNANYVQVIRAPDLNAHADNRRVLLDEYAVQRGPILVGGEPLVRSVETGGELVYLREYSQPKRYAHLTGFYSFVYGRSNIEDTQNSVLSGTDDRFFVRRVVDLLTDQQPRGGSVSLTIDPAAQNAAFEGLGERKGAVVALEPDTGEILAMTSRPSYDPNRLSTHDADEGQQAKKALDENEDQPMLNRASQRRYPPGSTFKLVTAAAALSSGDYDPDTTVDAPAVLDLPQTTATLNNEGGGLCAGSEEISLEDALRVSCNTAFGRIGLDLGATALREQAELFGFGTEYLPEIRTATSVFPRDPDEPQTALSAIGQFDVAATPLQMAMVTAGIANDGEVMSPQLVAAQQGPDLEAISVTEPESLSRAMSRQDAEALNQMMRTVVTDGTGENARMNDVAVAGKTGTAQTTPDQPPYAWFVSFAPADNPQVAVAVLIEDANVDRDEVSGGQLAAPIAKDVMEAVIEP